MHALWCEDSRPSHTSANNSVSRGPPCQDGLELCSSGSAWKLSLGCRRGRQKGDYVALGTHLPSPLHQALPVSSQVDSVSPGGGHGRLERDLSFQVVTCLFFLTQSRPAHGPGTPAVTEGVDANYELGRERLEPREAQASAGSRWERELVHKSPLAFGSTSDGLQLEKSLPCENKCTWQQLVAEAIADSSLSSVSHQKHQGPGGSGSGLSWERFPGLTSCRCVHTYWVAAPSVAFGDVCWSTRPQSPVPDWTGDQPL